MLDILKDKKIAVLRGGKSAERKISLKTGKAILAALTRLGYDVIDIDPAENLHQSLVEAQVDLAFIALHGRYGEDGTIQGFLELEEIPYTGSGVLASSIAMDKVTSKRVFEQLNITTPKFLLFKADQKNTKLDSFKEGILEELGLPVVVKPALEGSSIGLSIVKEASQIIPALKEASKYDREIVIEEFIPGREITVGILGGQEPVVLPIVEIKPKEGVYDFAAKYTKGMTDFVVPANLSELVQQQVEHVSVAAYQALKCEGMGRVDLRLSPEGKAYVLEVNTIPGMTETSLLPQAAEANGISFDQLVEKILKYAVE